MTPALSLPVGETVCQAVYRSRPKERRRSRGLESLLASGGRLGAVAFAVRSCEPGAGFSAVQRAWFEQGGFSTEPVEVLVFSRRGEPAAGSREVRRHRALVIATALSSGAEAGRLRLVEVVDPVPDVCPVAVVIFPWVPAVPARRAS